MSSSHRAASFFPFHTGGSRFQLLPGALASIFSESTFKTTTKILGVVTSLSMELKRMEDNSDTITLVGNTLGFVTLVGNTLGFGTGV